MNRRSWIPLLVGLALAAFLALVPVCSAAVPDGFFKREIAFREVHLISNVPEQQIAPLVCRDANPSKIRAYHALSSVAKAGRGKDLVPTLFS